MLQIAKILKSNGTEGGLLFGFRGTDPEDIDTKEPVFIYFDELPVPFFIQSLTRKGNDKAIVFLNDVHSLKDAEELAGKAVFVDYEYEDDEEDDDLSALVGWTLKGVGPIVDYIDIAANPCLEVQTEKGTVLVPFNKDLVAKMNSRSKVLEMNLPEGLLDL